MSRQQTGAAGVRCRYSPILRGLLKLQNICKVVAGHPCSRAFFARPTAHASGDRPAMYPVRPGRGRADDVARALRAHFASFASHLRARDAQACRPMGSILSRKEPSDQPGTIQLEWEPGVGRYQIVMPSYVLPVRGGIIECEALRTEFPCGSSVTETFDALRSLATSP